MVPQLSALFIMESLSLPNQREPRKVEKIVLVPPDWKIVLVPPRLENCAGTPQIGKLCWYPQIGKLCRYPHANKLLQKCVIFNRVINLHSRGPTEQCFYVWEPHRGCQNKVKKVCWCHFIGEGQQSHKIVKCAGTPMFYTTPPINFSLFLEYLFTESIILWLG